MVADAERVPVGTAVADAVVSVETSCTYPDIEAFFRDVARMVRVGGHFLYTDLLLTALVDPFVALLEQLGFEVRHRRDITANVCASRDARAERQKLAFGATPDSDERTMAEFVGREGSRLYDSLTDGEHQYTILRFEKVRDVEPPAEPLLSEPIAALVRDQAQLAVDLLTIPSR